MTGPGRRAALAALALLGACASLPVDFPREDSRALAPDPATSLARSVDGRLTGDPDDNAFRLLPDGVAALLARVGLANASERSLDLQYYIWHGDLTGRLLLRALVGAADRGVRVRVLLDDVGTAADGEVLLAIDGHPNLQVRLFNPVASRRFRGMSMLSDFSRTNRRMHNKAFVADGCVAVLGGRNIGDEYFGASGDVAFGDLDVVTFGPVVSRVSASFDEYWNSPASIPIGALEGRSATPAEVDAMRRELDRSLEAQRDHPWVGRAREVAREFHAGLGGEEFRGPAHLLFDDPAKIARPADSRQGRLLPQLSQLGLGVEREILVVSPYFVPGREGVAFFRSLVARGVRVTILTNSLASNDVGAVHSGYRRYREELVDAGVSLWELKPTAAPRRGKAGKGAASRASLHAKTFIVDRRAVFIGSLNLDPRSVRLNTEVGLVCENGPMAEALAGGIEGALDRAAWQVVRRNGPDGTRRIAWVERHPGGEPQILTEEPETSWGRRLGVWFLGWLPIESQL